MDTSEGYIKMCDCPEIQGQRPKGQGWRNWGDDGDFVFVRHDDDPLDNRFHAGPSIVWNGCLPTSGYHNWREMWASVADEEVVWLPRQDQLQEMLGMGLDWQVRNVVSFYHDVMDDNAKSWEQLWLAFVMHEKGKHWDGEQWN